MTNFCASCGTATGGGKFCPKCGSPQPGASTAFSGSPANYPAPKKSPVWKIVLNTLAVLLALFVAAGYKAYHFIKDRVEDAKQELAKAKSGPPQRTQAGCDLLPREKAAEILGATVARVKGNEAGEMLEYCKYYSQPQSASDDETNDDSDSKSNDWASIAKKISKAAKDRPLLYAQIYRGNAAAALIGIKTVSRFAGNSEPSVPGPWDEAYFGPKDATFVVRKGDSGFLLDLTRIENKRTTAIELAKAMVPGI